MHTNVILTNKRRTRAQSNYTNTELKAWLVVKAPLTPSGQETEWVYSTAPDPHGGGEALTVRLD